MIPRRYYYHLSHFKLPLNFEPQLSLIQLLTVAISGQKKTTGKLFLNTDVLDICKFKLFKLQFHTETVGGKMFTYCIFNLINWSYIPGTASQPDLLFWFCKLGLAALLEYIKLLLWVLTFKTIQFEAYKGIYFVL